MGTGVMLLEDLPAEDRTKAGLADADRRGPAALRVTRDARAVLVLLAVASLSTAWTAPVAAEDNNTVRAGIYIIRYNASAEDISGPFAPSGLNVDVKNTNTVYFSYIRRLSTHLDLELAGGWPPKTETVGKGPATVGSVDGVQANVTGGAASTEDFNQVLSERMPMVSPTRSGARASNLSSLRSTPPSCRSESILLGRTRPSTAGGTGTADAAFAG